MRIKRMCMKNFRSVSDMTLDLTTPVTMLIAENGRGKSSVEMALQFLLTGSVKDIKNEDLIKHGLGSAFVSAVIDDGQETELKREIFSPASFQINGKDAKEEELADVAKNSSGIKMSQPSNKAFSYMSSDAMKQFLISGKTEGMKLSGIKELTAILSDGTILYRRESKGTKCYADGKTVTAKAFDDLITDRFGCPPEALKIVTSSDVMMAMDMQDFSGYLLQVLPVKADVDALFDKANLNKEERALLRPILPQSPLPVTVADITSAYKLLYSTRTEIGRDLTVLKGKAKYDGEKPELTSKECQKRLDDLNRQIGEARQTEETVKQAKARKAERDSLIKTRAEFCKEYNAISISSPVNEADAKALKDKEDAFRLEIETERKNATALREASAPLKKMLTNLQSDICPLCDKLVCKTDKSSVRQDLVNSISKNEELAIQADAKADAVSKSLEAVLEKEEEMRKQNELFNKKRDLYAKIKQLENSIPAKIEIPDSVSVDIETLRKDVARYTEMLKKAHAYEDSLMAKDDYDALKAQHAVYDSAVKKTEPRKGVLVNAVMEILLAPLEANMNSFASAIDKDFQMTFVMQDDGLELFCSPRGTNAFMKASALSTGERAIAALALMDLVNSVAGSKILVFDSAEMLDTGHMNALLDSLVSMGKEGRYDNIVVASVNEVTHADVNIVRL